MECDENYEKIKKLEKDNLDLQFKIDNSIVPASKLEIELEDVKKSQNNILLVF